MNTARFLQCVWPFYNMHERVNWHLNEDLKNYMCGALRDLAPFIQFKKCEKHVKISCQQTDFSNH